MNSTCRSGFLVSLLIAACAPSAQAQTSAPASRSVLEGVYSAAQAGRGKTTFSSVCANCHTTSQFKGSAFQATWEGRSVLSLLEQLSGTMPIDNPGGLSRGEYLSVVAYLLQLNGYPAGRTALPAEADALKRIRFELKTDSVGSAPAR